MYSCYDKYCDCGIREIKEAENRNMSYRFMAFNEVAGGSHKSWLTHKLLGHRIVKVEDCSPIGSIEYCECGKSWAM